jgi:transketolase
VPERARARLHRVSFSENVAARYAAYGWDTQIVDWRRQGRYAEGVDALLDAI